MSKQWSFRSVSNFRAAGTGVWEGVLALRPIRMIRFERAHRRSAHNRRRPPGHLRCRYPASGRLRWRWRRGWVQYAGQHGRVWIGRHLLKHPGRRQSVPTAVHDAGGVSGGRELQRHRQHQRKELSAGACHANAAGKPDIEEVSAPPVWKALANRGARGRA